VLSAYEQRFARGALRADAAWMRVRVAERSGDRAAARSAARQLVAAHPGSPQARAARRLLEDSKR
jgi:Tfp pilus assembly protein PilF